MSTKVQCIRHTLHIIYSNKIAHRYIASLVAIMIVLVSWIPLFGAHFNPFLLPVVFALAYAPFLSAIISAPILAEGKRLLELRTDSEGFKSVLIGAISIASVLFMGVYVFISMILVFFHSALVQFAPILSSEYVPDPVLFIIMIGCTVSVYVMYFLLVPWFIVNLKITILHESERDEYANLEQRIFSFGAWSVFLANLADIAIWVTTFDVIAITTVGTSLLWLMGLSGGLLIIAINLGVSAYLWKTGWSRIGNYSPQQAPIYISDN